MKHFRRILSMLLCLILGFGLFTGLSLPAAAGSRGNDAVVLDDELPVVPVQTLPKITGHSISLKGQIDVNFFLTIPSSLLRNGGYVTLNDEKVTPVKRQDGQPGYKVTLALPAKEMGREVVLKVFQGNGTQVQIKENGMTVDQSVYCVQEYLEQVIDNDEGTYQDDLIVLCEAMSDYGSYTQKFLGYDVEHALDPYFPEEVAEVTATDYGFSIGEDTESLHYYGSSLLTKSETTLRLYFRAKGSLEEFSASIDGVEAEVKQAGNSYIYIDLNNISAKNLGDGHSFTVKKGEESLTVSGISAYSYVQRVLENESEESLRMAVKALKRYGDLAKAYFDEHGDS